MTTQEIITIAKEKPGKDITEQDAQDYIDGKAAIPDEALDLVSGGEGCSTQSTCPVCQQPVLVGAYRMPYCNNPRCSQYNMGVLSKMN
jgi:hypothetical protein